MANPFTVAVPNALQALMAGEQGYQGMRDLQSQRALAEAGQLYAAGDLRGAQAAAARGGNLQALMGFSNLANQDRGFQFQQSEAQRAQGNTDRQFQLAQKQAEEKPQYIKDDQGNIIEILPFGKGARAVNVQGQPGPSNPFSYGKMTETESKDSGYANRMFQSENVLRDPKLAAASQSLIDRAADRVLPGDIANKFVTSEGYQKYDQAARDFINATLRRESGAAISQSEFDNAYKQYLPRPGDSQDVLLQKQQNRQATIASIAGGGGKNYKPPYSFGPKGEMVATGNAQQGSTQAGAAPAAPATPAAQPRKAAPPEVISEAKAAIAAGADRGKVAKRLVEQGYTPAGI